MQNDLAAEFSQSDEEGNDSDVEQASEAESEEDTAKFSYINDDATKSTEPRKKKKKLNDLEAKKKLLEQEELNHFRNVQRISVTGKRVADPIRTFDELGEKYKVPDKLIENLAVCGYPLPTPIQMQAVPIMLQVVLGAGILFE